MRHNPKFDEVADDYAEHVAADKERKTATVKFASGRPMPSVCGWRNSSWK